MMEFESFVTEIVNRIKEYLPDHFADYQVKIQKVVKNNDQTLTGLIVQNPDSNITPTIYLDNFYKMYEDGKDLDEILSIIADTRARNDVPDCFDTSYILDLDEIKDKIMPYLVAKNANTEYLVDKPHTNIEDLTIIYKIALGPFNSGNATVPITNAMTDMYGLTTEELHKIAIENLNKKTPKIKPMRDILIEMMFPGGFDENDPRAMLIPAENEGPEMIIVTNEEGLGGASMILSDKTMDEVAKKLNGSFVIIPSSIHEVICIPVDEKTDKNVINEMIREVNTTQVDPGERLSDQAYIYTPDERKFVTL